MSAPVKFPTIPSKTLSVSINAAAYTLQISDILGWDGIELSSADFGTELWAVLRDSTNSFMEIIQLDPTTIQNSVITVLKRGLDFYGGNVEITANKLTWIKNDTIVELGSNPPQLLKAITDYIDSIAIAGAPNATTILQGLVQVPTAAQINAGTAAGSTTAPLAVTPDQLALSNYGTRLLTVAQQAALAGTVGAPSGTNLFVTNQNVYIDTDQSQTTQDSTIAVGKANTTGNQNKVAQSFIPTTSKIRGVALYKQADSASFTGTMTVTLQADSAGSPSGTPLATATITNAVWLLLATGEFQVTFSTEYDAATVGSIYWIVVSTSTADSTNHPNLGYNSAGGYTNGTAKFNNTTDGWVTQAFDLYFKTFGGTIGQIPEGGTTSFIPVSIVPNGVIDIDATTSTAAVNTTKIAYQKVIPSGTFKVNSGLRITTFFTGSQTASGNTVNIIVNGTTIATLTNPGTVAGNHSIEVTFFNNGSLSSQIVFPKTILQESATTSLIVCSPATASIDTSSTVVVQIQLVTPNVSSATTSYLGSIIEKVSK